MRDDHIRRDLRSAIAMAYELRRHEHIQHREWIASALADLEAELLRIEARLGGPRAHEIFPSVLDLSLDDLDDVREDAGPIVSEQIRALVRSVRRIQHELRQIPRHSASALARSRPTAGVALGAAAAVAPFLLGYAKRAPLTSGVQVLLGMMVVATAIGLRSTRRALRRQA